VNGYVFDFEESDALTKILDTINLDALQAVGNFNATEFKNKYQDKLCKMNTYQRYYDR
jgi:hypothetical protein